MYEIIASSQNNTTPFAPNYPYMRVLWSACDRIVLTKPILSICALWRYTVMSDLLDILMNMSLQNAPDKPAAYHVETIRIALRQLKSLMEQDNEEGVCCD